MSLNFQLGAIPNWQEACYADHSKGLLNGRTETLIFSTMAVGLGEITEQNAVEFFLRLRTWVGIGREGSGIDEPYSTIILDDVKAHIGLRTNVSKEPLQRWYKRLFDDQQRSIAYLAREEQRRLERLTEEKQP